MAVSSSHTKHHLENLHPNISVFRHPDHLPDRQNLENSVLASIQNLTLDAAGISKMSGDALKGLYGMHDDIILYWAHHEKLCIVDGKTAFMGGLDLCFGRWDTHQHPIADVHPTDLKETLYPGQDYNNARILDFQDVAHWENNQLDRKATARMGWSDVAVSLHGPAVEDLRRHFVERWNFIYDEKYAVRKDPRHSKLVLYSRPLSSFAPQQGSPNPQQQAAYQAPSSIGSASPQPHHSQQPYAHNSQVQQQQQQQQQGGGVYSTPQTGHQHSSPATPELHGSAPHTSHGYQTSEYNAQQTQYQQYIPPPPGPPPSQPQYAQQPQWSAAETPSYYGSATTTPAAAQQQGAQQPQWNSPGAQTQTTFSPQAQSSPQPQTSAPYFPPPPSQDTQHSETRGFGGYGGGSTYSQGPQQTGQGRGFSTDIKGLKDFGKVLRGQLAGQVHMYQDRYLSGQPGKPQASVSCQIVRSCAKWSHGSSSTESSIAEAYASIIRESEHFVYIENQFFITATSDAQKPVKNKIGAAIVERILRAARAGQKYKIIVVIPSVPCFAGDLHDDASLGTRAIMEFQYNSINRGGHSIMESIAREGYNPMDYIRFYNLRSYDRINASAAMRQAEQRSGVSYQDARQQYDNTTTSSGHPAFDTTGQYQQYQQAAHQVAQTHVPTGSGRRWDSVSECYMLGGEDIRKVPWEHPGDVSEIDAFVTEELYVHSKVGTLLSLIVNNSKKRKRRQKEKKKPFFMIHLSLFFFSFNLLLHFGFLTKLYRL